MPPPQKGYKDLNHRDTLYRWIMRNRNGANELVIELKAVVNGRPLVAALPRIVNHGMVAAAIDFGLRNGWAPERAGEPFRCRYRQGAFRLPEADDQRSLP